MSSYRDFKNWINGSDDLELDDEMISNINPMMILSNFCLMDNFTIFLNKRLNNWIVMTKEYAEATDNLRQFYFELKSMYKAHRSKSFSTRFSFVPRKSSTRKKGIKAYSDEFNLLKDSDIDLLFSLMTDEDKEEIDVSLGLKTDTKKKKTTKKEMKEMKDWLNKEAANKAYSFKMLCEDICEEYEFEKGKK